MEDFPLAGNKVKKKLFGGGIENNKKFTVNCVEVQVKGGLQREFFAYHLHIRLQISGMGVS